MGQTSNLGRIGGRLALIAVFAALALGLLNPNKRLRPRPTQLGPDDFATHPVPVIRIDAHGIEQVGVPAGCFRRGADPQREPEVDGYETPQHDVCLSHSFWVDRYEVTNASYAQFVAAGGYRTREFWSDKGWAWKGERTAPDDPPGFMDADQPRVWVTWYEAEAYARWRGARLPTEAEWEYAARGPEARIWPWGDEWDGAKANTKESDSERTVAVTRFAEGQSWVGAYNMAGNAGEWVADWYDAHLYRAAQRLDPQSPDSGEERIMRGGAWAGPASSARTTRRSRGPPTNRSITLGLRLVSDR
jgi:iron(II)-dependent oxidoreductase